MSFDDLSFGLNVHAVGCRDGGVVSQFNISGGRDRYHTCTSILSMEKKMRSMCGGVLDRALVFGFSVGFDVCLRILLC